MLNHASFWKGCTHKYASSYPWSTVFSCVTCRYSHYLLLININRRHRDSPLGFCSLGSEIWTRTILKRKSLVSIYVCLANWQYDIHAFRCLTLYKSKVIFGCYVCNDFITNSIIVLSYRPIFENARGARARVSHIVIKMTRWAIDSLFIVVS